MLNAAPFARRPHRGRPTPAFSLTEAQRAEVEALLSRSSTPQGVARRAQALLLFAQHVPASDVARLLGVDERTVFKWRLRFGVADPLEKLTDAPRSGRPPSLFRRPTSHA